MQKTSMQTLLQKFSVVFLILLCFAIYITYINRTIWYDEAFTYVEYAGSPFRALFVYTAPNNHLTHSFLVWLSTTLIGDSLIAIRLPAFMFAILSLAYIYHLGRRTKDHNTGLLALALLASMHWFMQFVPNARGYTLTILLAMIGFEFIYFGQRSLSRADQRRLMIIIILLMMTLPTMALFIASLGVWLLIRVILKLEHRRLQTYIPSVIFGGLIGSVFYMSGLVSGSAGRFSNQFGYQHTTELIAEFVRQMTLDTMFPVMLVGLVIAIIVTIRQSPRLLTVFIAIFLIPMLLAFVQEIITGGVLYPRNYVYLTPFIALFAAYGLSSLLNRLPHSILITSVCSLLILFVMANDARFLANPTIDDAFQAAIGEYAQENDFFLPGCCMNYPNYYNNRGTNYVTFTETTERII